MEEERPRFDRWLRHRYPFLSRNQVSEVIDQGLVTDEKGRPLKKASLSVEGLSINTAPLDKAIEIARSGNSEISVPVVLESEEIWAVDKPAGLPSHPLHLLDQATLTHWAFARLSSVRTEFPAFQPTITPHRLDIDTSGVTIVAKTAQAYQKWRELFSRGRIVKTYLAWCWGAPIRSEWENHASIAHDSRDNRRMVAVTTGEKFRGAPLSASTSIRVKKKLDNPSRFLVEAVCTTGVTHQVRVHLAASGFPLLGDSLYDPQFSRRERKFPHHLLRAVKLDWSETGLVIGVEQEQFERMADGSG